ncbi:MAG: TlpA family protein disulfide reductase [Planctomycetes bacterium]|nr:TlpA family protein disulfide reductase [Planctomycetota bacterium]
MLRVFTGILLLLIASPTVSAREETPQLKRGTWFAWLDGPGGAITFELQIRQTRDKIDAWIVNGEESVPIPEVRFENDEFVFDFVHYNSILRAKSNASGTDLQGTWKRVRGHNKWTVMDFHAHWTPPETMPKPAQTGRRLNRSPFREALMLKGKWAVKFDSSSDPALAIFDVTSTGRITGTFLTTTGDYRYLGGIFEQRALTLSVFDGAHAFLFRAELGDDAVLRGDFWSRDTWHETWTAHQDRNARLPDAFQQTKWNDDASLADLKFRDLAGAYHSPAEEQYTGKARIIEVFGTWCPNCNDASAYLKELDETYRGRGLSILGLAFEMTGEFELDAKQVKRYVEYHHIDYPVLVAGISDKAAATKAFPVLDKVRSFPTFIFLDGQNNVKAIYTGFSGPATGKAYDKLREDFERIIEQMLEE